MAADIFCRSVDGNNANDGSTRALAKKTLEDNGMSSVGAGALTAAGAGGRVFCADDHAQISVGSVLITAGTVNAPIQILSTDFSTNGSGVPDLKAGASIANDNNGIMDLGGFAYCYGMTFTSERDMRVSVSGDLKWVFDTCALVPSIVSNSFLRIGPGVQGLVVLLNTTLTLSGNTFIQMNSGGRLLWLGGALIGNPTSKVFGTITRGLINVKNVDLSSCSNNLVSFSGSIAANRFFFERCKLNPSITILADSITNSINIVKLHSCDFADTTYNIIEEHYEGSIIDETTIVRTGGQSDGTTPLSLKMTTNANAIEFLQPLVGPPITQWTDKTGETTYTIEIIHDSLTALDDDEVWMELEFPGADAQGDIANDKLASILTTPAAQASSTKAWTTTGLTNPNKQKLSVTVTPGKVGPVTARVYLAKPSTTIYVDQLIAET